MQSAAGERARVVAAVDGESAVDEDVFHARGQNFGVLVGGLIGDGCRVKNDDVSNVALAK